MPEYNSFVTLHLIPGDAAISPQLPDDADVTVLAVKGGVVITDRDLVPTATDNMVGTSVYVGGVLPEGKSVKFVYRALQTFNGNLYFASANTVAQGPSVVSIVAVNL